MRINGTKKAIGTVVSLACAFALVACGSSDDDAKASSATKANEFGAKLSPAAANLVPKGLKGDTLDNAVYNDYAPEMFLENGKIAGIQVDFANAIATVLGLDVKNVGVGSFDSIIPGLAGGRYDLATSAFGVTAERLKQVDFVSHFDIGTGFAVKKGSDLSLSEQNDLCGHSVGVLQGSYFVQQVEEFGAACKAAGEAAIDLKQFPTASAGVLAIDNGRVDVYAASQDALAYQAKQSGKLQVEELVAATLPQAFAFPKKSELVKPVLAAMVELHKSGVYQAILKKWDISSVGYADATDFSINNPKPVS